MQHVEDYTEEVHQTEIKTKKIIIGKCEKIGECVTQEDRISTDTSELSKKLKRLTPQQRNHVMSLLFLIMQQAVAENAAFYAMGSCACIATVWCSLQKIYISTSYVGDSVAFLVVMDQHGRVKYTEACNPYLHNVYNAQEIEAIVKGIGREAIPGTKINTRLGLQLELSRSIGDLAIEEFGLSHAPMTTLVEKNIDATDLVYLVVTCDGAMARPEPHRITPAQFAGELGELFSTARAAGIHTASALAELVVNNGIEKGSTDNVSALVIPCGLSTPAVSAAVFDGHSGVEVAEFCNAKWQEYLASVFTIYQHLQTKENPEQRIAEFDAVIHAILNFDKHNHLPMFQQLIKEIKSHVHNSSELEVPVNLLTKIRDYYLAQLKKMGVVPPDYTVTQEKIKPVDVNYKLSESEMQQKSVLSNLYIYLQQSAAANKGNLALIKYKLTQSFGKPEQCIAAVQSICNKFQMKKNNRLFKLNFTKQQVIEESAMLSITELMTALTVPAAHHRSMEEILKDIQDALEIKINNSNLEPVQAP